MGIKTFKGGYRFKRFKGQAKAGMIPFDVPSRVIIPLHQGFGTPLAPIVNVGDQVKAGQIIAEDGSSISSPIHATISGKVTSIEKKNYFKREINFVAIQGDGSKDIARLEGYNSDWSKLDTRKVEELLYKSGVTSLERSGIPTSFKSSVVAPSDITNIMVHGMESEVYNTSLEVLLTGRNLEKFVDGIRILKRVMPNARAMVVLNKSHGSLISKTRKLAKSIGGFSVIKTVSKYPQGYDEVLIPTILGKQFPYGYSAANMGIIVLSVQAVVQAYEAVAEGMPVIERTVALCGPSFKENIHVKIRVGTPLETVLKNRLKNSPARVILNSLMTGTELKDLMLPIDRTYSQIIAIPENADREFLAFLRPGLRADSYTTTFLSTYLRTCKIADTNIYGEQRACIQCGYCISVCPVRIIPTHINRLAKISINEALLRYGVFKCIDCNLCSYVCPSKIPLSKNIKDAKSKLTEAGCDHSLCHAPKYDLKGIDEYRGLKGTR